MQWDAGAYAGVVTRADVYLDWAAQAPLHPAAREALLAAYDAGWADPLRLHREGRRARLLHDAAREAAAAVIGVRPSELSFTASGTAAAHAAVLGVLSGRARTSDLLVTSPVEHSCVLHAAAFHESQGGRAARLGVDRTGRVSPETLARALDAPVALVSVQTANQEIGTRQETAALAEVCRRSDVPLHVDAAQSIGQLPQSNADWDADLVTGSAHKFGGPAGVGILAVRAGTRFRAYGPADDRGDGRIAGPLDVPGAVATAAALVARRGEIETENVRRLALTERIRTAAARIPDTDIHGDPDPAGRLPHLVSLSFLYVDGEALLDRLERAGVSAASGSACSSSALSPSHVLEAVGALTHGNVRVSLGRDTTEADVDRLLAVLPGAVADLRAEAGVAGL